MHLHIHSICIYVQNVCVYIQKASLQNVNKYYSTFGFKNVRRTLQALKNI